MEDLSHWPLVVGVYRHRLTQETYLAHLEHWQSWLAREEPFAVLRVYVTPESLAPPDGSAAAGKLWLTQNRPLIQRWVKGMATVVQPTQDYVRLKNIQVEKAFGVPGGVFAHWQPAVEWLHRTVFEPAGIPMPDLSMPDLA